MKHLRSLLWILVVMSFITGACAQPAPTPVPTQPPAKAPEPTKVPEPTKASAPTKTPEPTKAPTPPPDILLPDEVVAAIQTFIKDQKLAPGKGLAVEHTIIYALPDSYGSYTPMDARIPNLKPGVAYLLTPRRDAPWAKDPPKGLNELQGQLLGALKVVQQLIPALPPDTYAITYDPEKSGIKFVGGNNTAIFAGRIGALPVPIAAGRPVALITGRQMCFTWDKTQICAEVPTPLPKELREKLTSAMKDLGSDPTLLDLDGAVPDVEGLNVLTDCQNALRAKPPAYDKCTASVLAAPIIAENKVPAPPPPTADTDTISASTVLVVLRAIQDIICTEVKCDTAVQKVGDIPAGPYLMYDIVLKSDPRLKDTAATQSRAGMSKGVKRPPEFYLPAVIGARYMGQPALEWPEAIISNLLIYKKDGSCSCYFKWWQCPEW